MRVLVICVLCMAGAIAVQYLIGAVAPQLHPVARGLLVAPFYVTMGLTVRAAAERRRRARSRREVS